MKRNQLSGGAIVGGAMLLSGCVFNPPPQPVVESADQVSQATPSEAVISGSAGDAVTASPAELTYETYNLPTSQVHVVTVPPGGFEIQVAMAESLTTLPDLAAAAGAIAAINAGFFDPQNGLTTSYVTVAGAIVADPQQNDRLIQNPDLQSYLPAILNRSEFRIYDCAGETRYAITVHQAPAPASCTIDGAVGAGPQLLPTMTGYAEGFMADNESGELVRDALGGQVANARSAIGIKADGTVVLAIARQLPSTEFPTGLNFQEMADFLQRLGVEQALNLDGGSSSSLYFEGQTYFGRLDESGNPVERPIKSILLVR